MRNDSSLLSGGHGVYLFRQGRHGKIHEGRGALFTARRSENAFCRTCSKCRKPLRHKTFQRSGITFLPPEALAGFLRRMRRLHARCYVEVFLLRIATQSEGSSRHSFQAFFQKRDILFRLFVMTRHTRTVKTRHARPPIAQRRRLNKNVCLHRAILRGFKIFSFTWYNITQLKCFWERSRH